MLEIFEELLKSPSLLTDTKKIIQAGHLLLEKPSLWHNFKQFNSDNHHYMFNEGKQDENTLWLVNLSGRIVYNLSNPADPYDNDAGYFLIETLVKNNVV